MFGLSFGELVVLLLVAVVVLGPKELPRYLRKAGQLAGRLRSLAWEMREKSGIDEVLRSEGLDRDIAEIRRLATFARSELGGIVSAVRSTALGARIDDVAGSPYAPPLPPTNGAGQVPAMPAGAAATAVGVAAATHAASPPLPFGHVGPTAMNVDREHEYPSGGPDTYGALPENADVYGGALPPSALALDPLYARGSEDAPAEEASAETPADNPAQSQAEAQS